MKFEDNIEALVESIVEALGSKASKHDKMQELEGRRGVGRREKIEVMLEVVLEVLEQWGSEGERVLDDGQVLNEVRALRGDFQELVGRLENLKIKVPKEVVTGSENEDLTKEVADIKEMLVELKDGRPQSLLVKRLWWTIALLVAIIVVLSLWWFN